MRSNKGPISSVSAHGTTFIIVNDMDIAVDLLEKRSPIYSDRFVTTFGANVWVRVNPTWYHISQRVVSLGFGRMTSFLQHGPELKHHRRLMQEFIGSRAALTHVEDMQEVEAKHFLSTLLEGPDQFLKHIRLYVIYHITLSSCITGL